MRRETLLRYLTISLQIEKEAIREFRPDIVSWTTNMREVDERIRRYHQAAVQAMSEKLRETERMLFKLEENRKNSMVAIRDLEQTKESLLSFFRTG